MKVRKDYVRQKKATCRAVPAQRSHSNAYNVGNLVQCPFFTFLTPVG